jgi:hypothetical protein
MADVQRSEPYMCIQEIFSFNICLFALMIFVANKYEVLPACLLTLSAETELITIKGNTILPHFIRN